ncbi:MAG: type IV pilus twitching motility protein PilT [Candidatus Xenobia bacterium]
MKQLARERRGLVVVTGATGSGKSTTLAALLSDINHTREAHIVTIEDPLEFLHKRVKYLITHREVGLHASSFASALRAAVREDPDIILVGEMRDLETVSNALRAAEMGFLVLATLHTNSASKTVDRIIDMFPAGDQEQIRISLAESLKAVVAQQLVKRADGQGQVAASEVLLGSPALGNIIREGRTHQIPSVIQTGRDQGMMLMDHFLRDMVERGLITMSMAREKCTDLRNFEN